MIGSIKTLGYVSTSQLTVSEPHEVETKYHLIDGAHRWTAALNPVIWEKIQAMGKNQTFSHGEKFYEFLFHWLFYHKN